MDKNTVDHWVKVFDATNDVVEEARPGRPRATSSADDQKLVQNAEAHEKASAAEVAGSLKRLRVEVRTVRRRFNEAGLERLKPTFASLLNETSRKVRVNWAKENKSRNWEKVIFSDESTFELYHQTGRLWRHRGQPVFRGTVKSPVKVQVWGCLTAAGFG